MTKPTRIRKHDSGNFLKAFGSRAYPEMKKKLLYMDNVKFQKLYVFTSFLPKYLTLLDSKYQYEQCGSIPLSEAIMKEKLRRFSHSLQIKESWTSWNGVQRNSEVRSKGKLETSWEDEVTLLNNVEWKKSVSAVFTSGGLGQWWLIISSSRNNSSLESNFPVCHFKK